MKKKPKSATPKDTPATRNKRLQQRLREINAQNDREMNALTKSIGRIRATFRSKKSSKPTQ